MTFVPNGDVDPSTKLELDETAQSVLNPLSGVADQPKNGKAFLAPFAPVIFVEATDTSLSVGLNNTKYKPINVPDAENAPIAHGKATDDGSSTSTKQPTESTSSIAAGPVVPLDTYKLSPTWVVDKRSYGGLENLGNSCFMNSTLQVLLHTMPLINILWSHHPKNACPISADDDSYCFACGLRSLSTAMLGAKSSRPRAPDEMFANLRKIAPSFRRGRQEDAHEFLRFSIDALQLSAQRGQKDVPEKVAETSWVHRLFGGKFRSRVRCGECGHDSDTFETLLDLSVDVGRCDKLADALRRFSSVESLEGKNKYKCEKCNKPVNAKKQITVDKAPHTLCIQLKRFTPWGRKLTHNVEYPMKLSIQDVMSKGKISPAYNLYGIILHAGGTPNSGHYYAFVLDGSGKWKRMNDEDITPFIKPPLDHKNAYMLFYMREQSLDNVVAQAMAPSIPTSHNIIKSGPYTIPVAPKIQKRVVVDSDDEDTGKPVSSPPAKSRIKSLRTAEDDANPSPSKKPRYESNQEVESLPSQTPSYASAARTVKGPKTPQKLDLRNVSSEEEEDTQASPSSQFPPETQVAESSSMPALPISRNTTPEPVPIKIKPWQIEDDDSATPPSPTPNDIPLRSNIVESSNNNLARQGIMEDEIGDPIPAALKNAWTSSEPRLWTNGGLEGVIRPKKSYQSNAKKEQREQRRNVHNPYAYLGHSNSQPENGGAAHNGATIGKKKHRRPGGI